MVETGGRVVGGGVVGRGGCVVGGGVETAGRAIPIHLPKLQGTRRALKKCTRSFDSSRCPHDEELWEFLSGTRAARASGADFWFKDTPASQTQIKCSFLYFRCAASSAPGQFKVSSIIGDKRDGQSNADTVPKILRKERRNVKWLLSNRERRTPFERS